MRRALGSSWLVVSWLLGAGAAAAQDVTAAGRAVIAADPSSLRAPLLSAAAVAQTAGESGFRRFVTDVGRDYRNYLSVETLEWMAPGGVVALGVHQLDEEIRVETESPSPGLQTTLKGGDHYGNLTLQVPLAAVWWIAGHAGGHPKAASAGRDLVRAQISALSWTYALKYAVDRERPNGDPRSFPSGHASATFATATVLQQHYGWKLGVPFYALAAYTAASRISANKHWASDVTFGAIVGLTAGRAVTVRLRSHRMSLAPMPAPALGVIATVGGR
jgi:hypothetical protein